WRAACGSTAVVPPTATSPNAVYKGIAIAGNGNQDFRLFAADLFNGKIDVFDSAFKPTTVPGGFVDPNLPPGFAPFNIMSLQGNLYVAYAFHVAGDHDETAGPGLGIVDAFRCQRLSDQARGHGGQAQCPMGYGNRSRWL